MKTYLVTGGSGFLGELLKRRLSELGHTVVSVDVQPDDLSLPRVTSVQDDVRNETMLNQLAAQFKFDGIFHCAAMLAHAVKHKSSVWESNVGGTESIARFAKRHKVPRVVFISTNCLWAHNFHRLVTEADLPQPVEIYGKSKARCEQILLEHAGDFDTMIFRCPTIIEAGRLGLLSILFEFIDEGRRVWTVGGGANRYQFIYAPDLIAACLLGMESQLNGIFNIGSDNVKSFREVYSYVIDRAQTGARVASLPKAPTLWAMKVAHFLGISPLGPYQYKMIAEDFIFDTQKLKSSLDWRPTLTNEEMLWRSYEYYQQNRRAIESRGQRVSAHKQSASMGAIRLLKWLS